VRIRRLLFLLAPTILGGATPVHAALGPAPKCLPQATTRVAPETIDVKPPIAGLGEAVPNDDPEERDYLIRTIVFEAADEPDEGKASALTEAPVFAERAYAICSGICLARGGADQRTSIWI
jgi:hypothetical protein